MSSTPTSKLTERETYTPQPSARNFVVGTHPWAICETIDDPRLGLGFDQLSESLAPFGLPSDWGVALAAEYAAATWLVLSCTVGEMSARRAQWTAVATKLMASALADVPPLPVPFYDFTALWATAPDAVGTGLGNKESTFRKLAEAGEMRDVHAPLGARAWTVTGRRGGAVLDAAWERALVASDGKELLPLLPVPALCCFAPARRLTIIDGAEAFVPSLWELLATVLFQGPAVFHRRGMQSLLFTLDSEVKQRGRNSAGPPSPSTLTNYARAHNSWLHRIRESAAYLEVLEPWRFEPRSLKVTASMKTRAQTKAPRTAPTLARYRRARATLVTKVNNARRGKGVDIPWPQTNLRSQLFRLLLLDLAGQTGARVNEIVALTCADVSSAHGFGGDLVRPALYLIPSKNYDGNVRPSWRPISPETYELLAEWMRGWGITHPDAPLFPASENRLDEHMTPANAGSAFSANKDSVTPVIPHPADPNGGYGIHEVRHLIEQLAFGIGAGWLAANAEYQERVDPQVFADAALNHQFREAHAYKDLEANRELWAMRVALGDETKSAPGLISLLTGQAGARKCWDDGVIRSALSRLSRGTDQLADATRDQAAAQHEVARATRQLDRKPRAKRDIEKLDSSRALILVQEQLADMIARDELRDVREAARERRREAERQMSAAEKLIAGAQADLVLIKTRGRTKLIDDLAPLPGEVPASELQEVESFEEATERVQATITAVSVGLGLPDANDGESLIRIRIHLNFAEFAALYCVHPRTLRRWQDGTRRGPMSPGALKRVSVILGERRQFVRVTRLPESWWDGLSEGQRELVEQLLRVPMGSTQFGGASETEETLNAVVL